MVELQSTMAHSIFFVFFSFSLVFSHTHVESAEEGFISIDVSNKGLEFVKDLLIEKAISSLIPVQLPQIERTVNIPVLGKVFMVLSNISLYEIDVSSSIVETGDMGMVIIASGGTANLSMDWNYSYSTWWVPIGFSDEGSASVQVEGIAAGLTLNLKNKEGRLKLSLLDCACYVRDISIKLDGGASWLYQWLVNAFEGKIGSAIEDAISNQIVEGTLKLDSLLQSLPKEVAVNDIIALNITFVNDKLLSNSSLEFEIDGLFAPKGDELKELKYYGKSLKHPFGCKDSDKMVGISLHENVINSVSLVYFNANLMHWMVDKVSDQFLLNTAGWRFIVPRLYKLYPNDDMSLNISVASPPILKIEENNVYTRVYSDVVIDVLDDDEVVPVACFSLEIGASASLEILRNSLTGILNLENYTVSLKWSRIGNFHMYLVRPVISTVLRTVIVPYINLQLYEGLHLPVYHGYTLRQARVECNNSWITICSDVKYIYHKNGSLQLA